VYEVTDDVDKRTIFTVYLVIENDKKYKMSPDSERKFWHVSVFISPNKLSGLEYFFEVNIIGAI